ncbi:85_t:CDS:2 [Cetraspora pellucida]|uniref:85_t:CDS:1 n=1 Tax=Cetraspora pellucida TaxID=1433469 RepID=A0A9N9I713_9GLOM|nr:85_t:CDS:2 [Cetraspora pellucida]
MPKLIKKQILNFLNISIRITDDGHNVGHKVKHVLIIFTILDNLANIHKPEHYYTIILYSGAEDYNSLKNATRLLNNELHELSNNTNSTYFCLWCTISKKEQVNLDQE